MITENDVVQHVKDYLTGKDWKIVRTATTIEHGPDVVARAGQGKEIWVEAKGQTSSKEGTRRYGKEFNRNQKEDHLGRALLKCCQYLFKKPDLMVAIAVPSDDLDLKLIHGIRPALERLKVVTFLVKEDGSVDASPDPSAW